MLTYNDMTDREVILYRALERIIAANCRPGFAGYMNKADIAITAQGAIAAFEADLQAELGLEALEAIDAGEW